MYVCMFLLLIYLFPFIYVHLCSFIYYYYFVLFFSDSNTNDIKMTASLVFKKVSVEDLSKHYTCKLDTDNQPSRSVTITLANKGKYDLKRMDRFSFTFVGVQMVGSIRSRCSTNSAANPGNQSDLLIKHASFKGKFNLVILFK